MSQQTGKHTLYAKIAAVMAEMSGISKDGVNRHFDYKFVTADAVADKVRQLLSARGVAFFAAIVGREMLPMQRTYTDKKTGEVLTAYSNRWVVDFEFTFADSDTGEYEVRKWSAEADAADDKGINKCATAAEKYFLLKTFIVSTGDEPDADADGARKRTQAPQNGRQAQRPPQPPPAQSSPVSGGNSRPLASTPPTPSGSGNGDASSSAKGEFFPDDAVVMPLNTEGDADHLPRDVNGLPVLGSLDMKALGKLAQDEGLVKGRNHFSNLIDLLYREGSIRAASKPDAVMEAIRKHYASKDLAKEGVGAR